MDSFGLSASIKRREAENAKRREILRRMEEEKSNQLLAATQRTSHLIEQANIARQEQSLQAEIARIRDEGAPDGGVKYERVLEVSHSGALPADSDRVLLPSEILHDLSTEPRVTYPLMFEVAIPSTGRRTHCGVLEFSAEAGKIVLPQKVRDCLDVLPGASVRLRYKVLPKCTDVTLRVPLLSFSLFPDFKSFLESAFRSQYATLTVGDMLHAAGKVPLMVEKLEPEAAVCMIDTDVTLDLLVVEENEATSAQTVPRWTLGSDITFSLTDATGQARLWLNGGLAGVIEISSSKPVDLFVSFPPQTEASESEFDLSSLGDVDQGSSVTTLLLSPSDLRAHQSPAFVTVGIRRLTDGSSVSLSARLVVERTEATSSNTESQMCPNCEKPVGLSSFDLHRIRCEAQFRKCDVCSQIVRRVDFPHHNHCQDCNRLFRDRESHSQLWHSPIDCLCGQTVTRATLQQHRSTDCPNKLLLCRFCGCFVPKGDTSQMDARDRIMGFTSEHEASCGNRTDVCVLCGRRERLKDMQFHNQAYHS